MKLLFARYVLLQVLYSQTRPLTNVIQSLNLLLIKCIFYSIYVNFIHLDSIFLFFFSQEESMNFYDLLLTFARVENIMDIYWILKSFMNRHRNFTCSNNLSRKMGKCFGKCLVNEMPLFMKAIIKLLWHGEYKLWISF